MTNKFVAKVEEDGEFYFLARNADNEPTLVESIVGLYNKGFQFETSPIMVRQMAHKCGYNDYILIMFDCPTANGKKPFEEIRIAT